MRRTDKETSINEVLKVVDECEYAVISMVMPDHSPYCVPLSIVRMGESVYFHCTAEGQKICALRANPRVCLTCVGFTRRMEGESSANDQSTIIFGIAAEVLDDEVKVQVLRALCERYIPHNLGMFEKEMMNKIQKTAVWRIAITGITGRGKACSDMGRVTT